MAGDVARTCLREAAGEFVSAEACRSVCTLYSA